MLLLCALPWVYMTPVFCVVWFWFYQTLLGRTHRLRSSSLEGFTRAWGFSASLLGSPTSASHIHRAETPWVISPWPLNTAQMDSLRGSGSRYTQPVFKFHLFLFSTHPVWPDNGRKRFSQWPPAAFLPPQFVAVALVVLDPLCAKSSPFQDFLRLWAMSFPALSSYFDDQSVDPILKQAQHCQLKTWVTAPGIGFLVLCPIPKAGGTLPFLGQLLQASSWRVRPHLRQWIPWASDFDIKISCKVTWASAEYLLPWFGLRYLYPTTSNKGSWEKRNRKV